MATLIDLTGQVFGRLKVIKRSDLKNKSGSPRHTHWICKCECGVEKEFNGKSMRRGFTASCGCLRRDLMIKPALVVKVNKQFMSYRRSAIKRKLDFCLNIDQFRNIVLSPCIYCGYKSDKNIGIDRVDNKAGYLENNCVPCCTLCNKMKQKLTVCDFISHVDRISSFRSELSVGVVSITEGGVDGKNQNRSPKNNC